MLENFLKSGTIFLDGQNYIGIAADGVEVWLGSIGEENSLEWYLTEYPGPSHW